MTPRVLRRLLRFVAAAIAIVALLASPHRAAAESASNDALFAEGTAALEREAWDEAIDRFELLSDRGFVHPDASYDRAFAYVRRASTRAARPGDLGRAAAALSETLLARPGDVAAEQALDRVRQEITRKRSQRRVAPVDQRPSLGWAVVELLPERTWTLLAAAGSLALTIGLFLRLFLRGRAQKLAGVIAAGLGGTLLVTTGSLSYLSRYERLNRLPAVVIAEEARLLTDAGTAITGPGSAVPEGALVHVTERSGTLAHAEWGTLDGWVPLGQLRLLARP
jgi:hypothetical protein